MWWTADNFTALFWFAVIPAFLALALIVSALVALAGLLKVHGKIARKAA